MCNDYEAEVVRAHPDRFGLFATLPWLNVDDTLREIAHAYDDLKADGIGMLTNYEGTYPGDARLLPICEELNRRRATVYFHPNWPCCCKNLIPDVIDSTIDFPFDTTRTIVSLLAGGVIARFPNVRLIFAHGGGTLPMLAGRISWFLDRRPQTSGRFPNGSMAEIRKLYFDTALSTDSSAWAGLSALAHPDHILYGTDYNMARPIAPWRKEFDALNLPTERARAIEYGNAERLFPRFSST